MFCSLHARILYELFQTFRSSMVSFFSALGPIGRLI